MPLYRPFKGFLVVYLREPLTVLCRTLLQRVSLMVKGSEFVATPCVLWTNSDQKSEIVQISIHVPDRKASKKRFWEPKNS